MYLTVRVLLDESVPRQLASLLMQHEVKTVVQAGWAGTVNGKLLELANEHFDVFITGDQNLQYQQNLRTIRITILVIKARNNRVETILAMAPQINEALKNSRPGTVTVVTAT